MYFVTNTVKNAARHFAAEELFTRYLHLNDPVLMLWQTDLTVMLGNNQVLEAEVDTDIIKDINVSVVRRSSGGGAICTDKGSIQYTIIEPLLYDTKKHRETVATVVVGVLNDLKVPAEQKGRNDILVGEKKISGLAQYTSGTHLCTHGSLLFDTNLDILSKLLLAKPEKLHPKGITSVRSRVTNIKPLLKDVLSIDEFMLCLKTGFTQGKECRDYYFSDEDNKITDKIYNEKYANDAWNLRVEQ